MKRQLSEWEKIIANEATDRINLKNIQATPAAQFEKKNNKMTQSKNGPRN